MYPLCIYLLFFTPVKFNAAYKYMLFGCATTTYLNSILYCFWAPILTPEFFGVVFTGVFGKWVSKETNLDFFQAAIIILTNSHLCTVLLLVFQFSTLRPNSFLAKFGRTSQRLIITYLSYLALIIAISLILIPTALTSANEFNQYIHQNNDAFAKEIISRNFTVLSFTASINPTSYAFGTFMLLSSLFLFFLGLHYTIIVSKVIKHTRGIVSIWTHKREIMMFQAFVFKTAMLFLFYALPMLVYTVSLWLKLQYPLIGMLCNIIMVSHGSISYIGTIWLLRPYRKIVIGFMLRIKPKIIRRSSSVVPFTGKAINRSAIYATDC
uniref:Serpentine Receptor, class H n=1 Tax=Panagrolaimus davidi TaxID=227884 RepID=A0A914PKS9_9BILA